MHIPIPILIAFAASIISAIGQICLKYAMIKHGEIDLTFLGLIKLFTEPWLLFALLIYFFGLVAWLYVISKVPLSTAYPALALTYIIIPILSVFLFHESVGPYQVMGISFIFIGILIISVNI